MAVGMLVQIPGMTAEVYDSIMEHLDWNEKDLPEGFISHFAGPTDDGWLVFDVWESPEDWERFAEGRLGAAMGAAMGGDPPTVTPLFFPIHREDHARARV